MTLQLSPWQKLTPLLLIALAYPSTSVSDGFEIEMGLITHHWISKDLYEDNQLIGAGYKKWELATFVNSFGDRSYSAGYRWRLSPSFSLSSGVIHGYGENANWFPVRFDEEVIYFIFNAEPPTDGPLGIRLRVMGEATMISVVLKTDKGLSTLSTAPGLAPSNQSALQRKRPILDKQAKTELAYTFVIQNNAFPERLKAVP